MYIYVEKQSPRTSKIHPFPNSVCDSTTTRGPEQPSASKEVRSLAPPNRDPTQFVSARPMRQIPDPSRTVLFFLRDDLRTPFIPESYICMIIAYFAVHTAATITLRSTSMRQYILPFIINSMLLFLSNSHLELINVPGLRMFIFYSHNS